jgi:oxalate decarboxylase/phosphoglucose isomerase-like protein (cupin superfamily)
MSMVVAPGEGRVPYTPLPRRRPAYSGKIVVAREEGILEPRDYGSELKLLCRENTGDERFTVAERTYHPGAARMVEQRDSEAIHILKGHGLFRAWPKNVPEDLPVQAPLQPGMEIVVDQFVRHEIRVTGDEPLVALVTICHLDFPAYPHHYPAIFKPGRGNSLHMHDNRVEAFYVVDGPGAMSIADPDNHTVQDVIVPAGGIGYKPMYVYHRQFNPTDPATSQQDCYWIHSMVVFTHRGSRLPQVHLRQHELDGKTPYWPNTTHL